MEGNADNDKGLSLQDQKVFHEIKRLKLLNIIAVLSLVGSVIAFVIGNLADIKSLFYRPPAIKVVTNDAFLQQNGTLTVIDLSSDPEHTVLTTSVGEAADWITLDPGSYRFKVELNKIIKYDERMILKGGDKEALVINADNRMIQLKVVNNTPRPSPHASLSINVESSGNGYLWIYELLADNKYQKLYPPVGSYPERNYIKVGETFSLPDNRNFGLRAGDKVGQEDLVFIITSTYDVIAADDIAARMANAVTKAAGKEIWENWGVYKLSYQVEL